MNQRARKCDYERMTPEDVAEHLAFIAETERNVTAQLAARFEGDDEFEDVNSEELERTSSSSYRVLSQFLRTDKSLVKLVKADMKTYMALRAYIVAHKYPIKIMRREGRIYLQRKSSPDQNS